MRKSFVLTLVAGFTALLSAGATPVFAASATCNTGGCTTPGVDLNFQVVIPPFVRLRIGSAASADTLLFDMTSTPQDVGTSTPVTGTGGDVFSGSNSEVTVNVRANYGATSVQVQTANSASGLDCQASSGSCQNGSDFIGWDQITVAGNGCSVTPPGLTNGGGTSATYTPVGGIINEACTWLYQYANTTIPADGIYTGTVTYTATVSP